MAGRAVCRKALHARALAHWQMLLKGIAEVGAAGRPLAAAEMVLVRIAYAAISATPDEGSVPCRTARVLRSRARSGNAAAAPLVAAPVIGALAPGSRQTGGAPIPVLADVVERCAFSGAGVGAGDHHRLPAAEASAPALVVRAVPRS